MKPSRIQSKNQLFCCNMVWRLMPTVGFWTTQLLIMYSFLQDKVSMFGLATTEEISTVFNTRL